MKQLKIFLICLSSILLPACTFFDKDNTPPPSPLVSFNSEAPVKNVWQANAGSGVGKKYLNLLPNVSGQAVFTANHNGTVTAMNKTTGKKLWQTKTGISITGGPGTSSNLVFVGGQNGDVLALSQNDGSLQWKAKVSSEILASPIASQNIVLIKTIDGKLSALATEDGHQIWHHEQSEPFFILRGSSAPQISQNNVIVGFANGKLLRLSLNDGTLHWQQPLTLATGSFDIQRMIDIDADPIIHNNKIYAATYQGRISALDLYSGKPLWSHDISSFSSLVADNENVYVSDAKSHIWAFDANTGAVSWRQNELESRVTTGPALMGNYIVVGDGEGYLHWLNKQDGHFVARVRVNKSGILAKPTVNNNTLYALTSDGTLAAYTLG